MKSLPHCEHEKQKQKIPLEELKESPSRLQRLMNESLAFHLLEILCPVIVMSQERKKKKSRNTKILFAARGPVHVPCTWCAVQHNTWERSRSQEPAHLCDICVPLCWDSKSHSGKTTASLSPCHLVQRNLHGYGRKPNGRRSYD